jgi:twinkle protein
LTARAEPGTLSYMEKKSRVVSRQACPRCKEQGGDWDDNNLAVYDDGHGYCYACKYFLTSVQEGVTLSYSNTNGINYHGNLYHSNNSFRINDNSMTKEYIAWRGLSVATMRKYGVMTEVSPDGKPHRIILPYGDDTVKSRLYEDKQFFWSGATHNGLPLFGMDRFSAGSSKSITITEGELDAMSCYQMHGSRYPAVSVRSSTAALGDCTRAFEYLNSFEQIYICFDNDQPGQEAAREVGRLFDVNKVYHVKLTKHKDANDYLRSSDEKEFVSVWYNARPYTPKGIVSSYEDIGRVLEESDRTSIAEYPFSTLQGLTYGIRLGEVVLFTAQEKVGKTEVLRAIEYHVLKTTDENVGIIHLEEQEKRCVLGLVGYELECPAHLPDTPLSEDDALQAVKALTRTDGRLNIYSHFGSDNPDTIIDVIRYLAAVRNCKFIFLDHISMLVSAMEGDDERRKLDYISTKLAMLTRELGFTLFLVSHVNDEGKTRGSRYIAKIADLIIHLERNLEAPKMEDRHKTYLHVRGNRYAGATGPAGVLWFDPKKYKLEEMSEVWNNTGF